MALINCPECKKEVSDTALACPHCGFGVASYIQKERAMQQKLFEEKRKQEKKKQDIEKRQERAQTIKNKLNNAKEYRKTNQVNQCGKKSLWIFVPLVLYSVILGPMPYIKNYFIMKQLGILSDHDNLATWFVQYILPSMPVFTLAALMFFVIPCVFYVIANFVKNKKSAKVMLFSGLLYHALFFAVVLVSNIVNTFNIGAVVMIAIPLVFYFVLFYKAIYGRK